MSTQSPPTLLELAGHSLLSDKSRAILDLEDMPIELFPPLFVEAFSRGHTEVLKKMVQAWPFTCLPLGALMRKPQLKMLQVALDGLDMLLAQQDHPRRWKLQVWICSMFTTTSGERGPGSGAMVNASSPEAEDLMETHQPHQEGPETTAAGHCPEGGSALHLGALHLGCLCSFLGPDEEPEEAEVSQFRVPAHISPEEQEWLLTQITSQFLRMDCLWKFCVDAVLFLESHLEQVLGERRGGGLEMMDPPGLSSGGERLTLKFGDVYEQILQPKVSWGSTIMRRTGSQTPLKTLSLRGCPLKEKDLKHLSMCPSTDQLKCLDLSSFSMKGMSPEPLRVLLEKVAHILETLVLEFCEITESQLNAISPALGHYSQLKTFSFYGNQIPLTALKNLLSHTASLPLEQEKYPAPLESFDEILWGFWTEINPMKFDQVQKELMQLVKDIRPVHDIQIYSYNCILHFKHTDFIA
ncbi:Hypothetical predicted protein [Marmota monax]|uniref:Uncharacterized protein n=1 Tax=Marmota monax TaxID=9995 RepID=A0A5E4D870_MARMO|nr:Hypothetical predicted protein [Marmota monax]